MTRDRAKSLEGEVAFTQTKLYAAEERICILQTQIAHLDRYRRAMESMAAQFIHPKVSAEQMVKEILGEE